MSALDAIRKLSADYETAHLAGDGQALARLFGDDAVIIPPGKPAIEGRKRIDEFFSGVTGGTGLKTETLRIEVHGSIAYAYGTSDFIASTMWGRPSRTFLIDRTGRPRASR